MINDFRIYPENMQKIINIIFLDREFAIFLCVVREHAWAFKLFVNRNIFMNIYRVNDMFHILFTGYPKR